MNHVLSPKCAQQFEDKARKKHISNLIQFFVFQFFSTFSLLGRVTLSRSSFIQTNIFCKIFFFIIFNMVRFFVNLFYSRQNIIIIFFYQFSFDTQKYFFEGNEYDTHLLNFSFFIQNKLSSYFEKEKERKPFFLYFFRN